MHVGSVGSERSRSLAEGPARFVTDKTLLLSESGKHEQRVQQGAKSTLFWSPAGDVESKYLVNRPGDASRSGPIQRRHCRSSRGLRPRGRANVSDMRRTGGSIASRAPHSFLISHVELNSQSGRSEQEGREQIT
jgi:hypothetical protein